MSETSLIFSKLQQDGINIAFRNISILNVAFRAPCYVGSHFQCIQSIFDAYNCVGNYNKLFNCISSRYNTFGNHIFTGLGQHSINEISTSAAFYTNELFEAVKRDNSVKQEKGTLLTKVLVKNDVYIHDHAVFINNLTVNNGAVVLPGAIISKDVPPYAIVGGANQIQGYRYSDEVISDLLEANWWQYDLPKIASLGYKLPTYSPSDLIQFLKDLNPEHKITFQDEWILFKRTSIDGKEENIISKVKSDQVIDYLLKP